MEHTASIPEWYLLVIATRGDMGDDDLPGLMQTWAEKECDRLGLNKKLREARRENLKRLRDRMKKTLGSDLVDEMDDYIDDAIAEFRGEKMKENTVLDTLSGLIDLIDDASDEHGSLAAAFTPEYQATYIKACRLLDREPHEMLR